MAGSFRIAEGYVEVTADESGYNRAMDRLKNRRNEIAVGLKLDDRDAKTTLAGFLRDRTLRVRIDLDKTALSRLKLQDLTVSVAPQISDAAYNRVRTQLDRLTAERTVNIRTSVDTRVGAADLANLTRRRTVRIGTDVDTRVAADSLANLVRRRDMTVGVRLDDTAARARLDLLARDRTTHLRVDVDRNALSSLTSAGGGALSSITGAIFSLGTVAATSFPMVASLAASVVAMAPAALTAVPAVLSLGAAFAAIKIGTSGIGDAFKQAFAPATSSANAAASATRQVENAQRSLAKAQQSVKDAEVNAAAARVKAARDIQDAQQSLKNTVSDVADANRRAVQQVAQAERSLADAQRQAKQAQLDLTQARKDAAQELEDLNNRLTDAQLDQRQKVLDLQDAEQNLAAVKAKGSAASKEDLDKAQLQYDQAQQALAEQQTETERLQTQTEAANKAGVDGSKTVVDAKSQVKDATQAVADQTQALKDAELEQTRTALDGQQKIAKAERDVADARAAAAKAATDGARQIADAQAAAADAARSLADAQTAGAAATSKTADAMAKLAPNARAFVSAVVAQGAAWRSLKLDVQNTLFAGLGQKFTALASAVLPSLKTGLTGTAGVLNTMAKNAFDAVTNLGKTGQLKSLFAGLNSGLKPLAKIPGQFITGLTQIGIAASPAFKRITTATGGVFTRISQQIDTAAKNGHLEKIIDQALDVAKQFGKLLGNILGTLGNVMKAASSAGGDALGALGSVFAELRKITAMPEVQKALTTTFKALADVGKLLAGVVGTALQAALPLLASLAPFVSTLAKQLAPVLGTLLTTLGKALTPIMDALLPVLGTIGNLLVGLVKSLTPLLKPIGDLIGAVIKAIAPVIDLFAKNLTVIVGALVQGLAPVIEGLVPVIQQFGQFFAQLVPAFSQVYPALLPLIPPLTQLNLALLDLTMKVLTPLLPLIARLATMLAGVLTGAIGTLVPVIDTVVTSITGFVTSISSGVQSVVKVFQWLYDTLVGHSIIPDLVNAIIGWFATLWTKTKALFTALKTGVAQIWRDLWSAVRTNWNTFYDGLRTAISNAWTSVKNGVSSLKTSITNTWSSMWTGVKNTVTSTFTTLNSKISGFASGMRSAFTNLKNALGTIWDGIKSKISAPVKWVVSNVYNNGIRRMWNTIAGKISSKLTLPSIALGFNKGGVVPGSGNSDTVPAMLTPGERILSKQQVTKLGGHKGIDAILGQDKPTKTGGNPSRQQERQRYQGGTQHFAGGGIVGNVTHAIGGAIGSAVDWTKDLVIGGLKAAAQKALSSLVRPLIGQIPAGGVGSLMKTMSNKAVDGMLSFLGNEDKKAVGGPAVQKALAWVKTQNGLPYQWAGNGNPSWDCSGLMSAIESVIRGEKPHRRWATGSFVGNSGPSGWVRNLNSPFMIGITNAGVGHTAGTLAGMNVESSGGAGVHMGKSARGYNNSLFTSHWGFAPAAKYDSGGLLQPGATMAINATRKPEAVLTAEEHEAFRSIVTGLGTGMTSGVQVTLNMTVNSATLPSPAERRRFAVGMADDMKEALRKLDNSRSR